MAYTKVQWRNNQSPPINADNLNHIEEGIYEAHQNIAENVQSIENLVIQSNTNANAITSETIARQQADTTETLARESADSNLQTQINQIIAPSGEAPSAAEVQNARIAATVLGGETYDTLGDSIRGQVTDLKSELTGTQNVLNLITDVIYPNSGYIDTSGVVHTNDNFWYSDLIPVNELQKSVSIYWHNAVATFTFYDSNGDYLNEYVKKSSTGVASAIITIPSDAVYVKVCTDPSFANQVYCLSSQIKNSYNETIIPKITNATYQYDSGTEATYISDRIIEAGNYVAFVGIQARSSGNGFVFLVDANNNTVINKKEISVTTGWNNIFWGAKAESDCYFAFHHFPIKYTTFALGAKTESCFATDGLYEATPTNPEINDVVTITKTASERAYAFTINWSVVNGTLMDIIYGYINDINYIPYTDSIIPPMYTESYYTNGSPNSCYVSTRIIPSGSYLKTIKIKSSTSYIGRIVIIDNDTNIITDVIEVDLNSGWNTIVINKYIATDSYLAFDSTRAYFWQTTNNAFTQYSLSTDGLYETSSSLVVGNTVTLNKTSDKLSLFAIQWEIEAGSVIDISGKLISDAFDNTISNLQEKPTFNLNNGALLSYSAIDENIGYMGRWFDYNGKPCTNNDGSELYFKVKGANTITANFGQITTQTVTPYIAVSIDGGDFVRQQISTSTISLPDTGEHIVRIVIDGMTEAQGGSKWLETLGIYVNSITVDSGTIIGLYPRNKIGMFYGDSITEGINALATGANASVNSAVGSYPYFCCEALNAVSYRVGYGATGLTATGSFNTCEKAIDYLYNNQPTGEFSPDFIVINHGVNDNGLGVSDSDFIEAYNIVIEKLRAKYSAVPIFCVVPFKSSQPYSDVIRGMCEDYSNTYFVSSANWNGQTTDSTHLSVQGAKNNGGLLAKAILKVLGESFFINLR